MNNDNRQKANIRHKKVIAKRKKRAIAKRFFVLTIILYVFLILAFLFFFSISLKSCNKQEPLYDVAIEGEENKEVLKHEKLYIDDVLYLSLSDLSKLTEVKVTGDKDNIAFILDCNDEYAKFVIGTTFAEVNSNEIVLPQKSLMLDGELYLPFDFFKEHMTGFIIDLNEDESTYTISLDPNNEPQFILKAPSESDPLTEGEYIDKTEDPMDFVLDLSSYEEYMNPTDRDAYLMLVSPASPLTKDYAPTDLTGSIFTRSDRDTRMLRKYACLALEAFLKEGEANGVHGVTVTSAYRDYDYQNQLFQQEVQQQGGDAEEAAKYVNPPGSSEHQSGLAVDMHNMSAASKAFGDTMEAKWLAENAHKFGFILRYPKSKIDVTGIDYEPWHFRYVGRYHATKMYELGMCLEEYLEYINQ